ncbi:MAG: DNA repair protein RecN [Flavobacteriaceae bacterium]
MITKISIKNFALIDFIEIDFLSGFSSITGDTGSGKSILLSALSLITGKRADHSMLKNKKSKCVVEVDFDLTNFDLVNIFENSNLDYQENSIFRREILINGKSRSFINDTPTNLETLKFIGEKILDIHTQNESLLLSKDDFFFSLIDNLCEQKNIVKNFSENLNIYKEKKIELEKLTRLNKSFKDDFDYNNFLFNELNDIKLNTEEHKMQEEKLKILKNSKEISISLNELNNLIYDGENSIQNQLNFCNRLLNNISKYSDNFTNTKERVESIIIEIEDIKSELSQLSFDFNDSQSNINDIEERLDKIYALEKKHSVSSVEQLIEIKINLEQKLQKNEGLQIDIENIKNEILNKESLLNEQSKKISISRKKIVPKLKQKLEHILSSLGMKNSSFQFIINESQDFNSFGKDSIQVLFSANKGIKYYPIFKVVSGGELSRILLTIKSILSEHLNLPTMIFDEIDTGISGEMSNAMGNMMLKMSRTMQIISITHLPQIASKADHQYNIYKKENLNITETKIKKLNNKERIKEIAKMLSGDNISDTAIIHAKELLNK